MFDSDNFGRQWLTREARTGAAPENAPLRLALLWYNYENAPSTSHYYCKMHPTLPAATLWYNCTPASFGTFCSTLPSYTWYSTTTLQTSLAVENHSIQSPFALQLCFCLFQASKSRVYDHLTSLYDTSYIVYHKTWLPNQKTTI